MNSLELKEYIDTFDKKFDGNHSIIYPYMKDQLSVYEEFTLPFPEEFLFFEDRYVKIYKDIKKRKLKSDTLIDIGCQLGIQSEIFRQEYNYLGIDSCSEKFFNSNHNKCKYITGIFPNIDLKYDNSIVISSMSLGYFFNEDEEETYFNGIVEELKKAKYLYIATNRKLIAMLSDYFDLEHLDDPINDEEMIDVSNNLYFMKRKIS